MWALLECMQTTLMLSFLQLLYLILSPKSIMSDLKYTDRWLKANKLSLNDAKTAFMVISSRQKLQSLNDYTMNIHIDGVSTNQSNESKSLWLIIDENLSWKVHIHEISKQVSSGIGALEQLRPFVSIHTVIKIYRGLIEPHSDYCSAVWNSITPNSLVKNFKNFWIVLSELSLDLAMIVPDFFLTRLVGTIYLWE